MYDNLVSFMAATLLFTSVAVDNKDIRSSDVPSIDLLRDRGYAVLDLARDV